MSITLSHLVGYLADDTTRKAFLYGIILGFCLVPPSFMLGLRCSGRYLQFLASQKRECEEKKADKKLQRALASGMSLSHDGRFVIDTNGTLLCRSCIRKGREMAVTEFDNGTYRCPLCRSECYVPFGDAAKYPR